MQSSTHPFLPLCFLILQTLTSFPFDFLGDSLNMRTTITVYRTLYKYVCAVDAEYAAELAAKSASTSASASTTASSTTLPPTNGAAASSSLPSSPYPPESPAIDPHFRSGVYLGAGMSTLILSLLPARLLNIIELFGYAADRAEALEILGRAGGWGRPAASGDTSSAADADDEAGPSVSTEQEGVRRAICDMALLIFHLVLSSYTFDGVDTRTAARIVKWNLKRYPEGAFSRFLRSSLRARPLRSLPDTNARNVLRCLLPLRCGPPRAHALAAARGDRVLHQGHGCAEPIP